MLPGNVFGQEKRELFVDQLADKEGGELRGTATSLELNYATV